MKKVISYLCLGGLCTFLFSCESESKSEEAKKTGKEVEIVEEASSSSSFESRSYTYDIVNELYKELLKEDKVLAELENSTTELLEKRSDTEDVFKHYNSKSENYYTSAKVHLNSIRDSVLKQKYKNLILKSQEKYEYKIKDLEKIIEDNNLKVLRIEDLRNVLKLATTLAFIEKYQDKAKPDKRPLNAINKELSIKAAEIQKKIAK